MYDCILFDLDGTLMDTSVGVLKAVEYTVKEMNLEELDQEVLKTFIGPPIYESFKKYYDMDQETVDKATEIFRNAYKDIFLFDAIAYEGIYDLLAKLRKSGYKLAVATNKRHDYTMKLLEHYDFVDKFDYICGSDFENKLKKSDIILKCLDELGIKDKDRAVIIGDTIHDYNGAQKAGIKFIGVTYGFGLHTKEDLELITDSKYFESVELLNKFF